MSGDSLWSIAKKNNISVDKLKDINNLNSNLLSIGQKLIINEEAEDNQQIDDYYIVEAGDTLYSISRKNGISVDEIKRINKLLTDQLSIGQKLLLKQEVIEDGESYYDIYTVQKGDSLYAIAQKFSTSVDNLKDINNLNSDLLNIGMKLLVPGNSSKVYVVQKGDTLYAIARKNNVTVTDIINLDNLTTSNLSIGQLLLIP